MANIHIDGEICKGCELCIHYCPRDVFEMSQTLNKKGFAIASAVRPEKCIYCKMCEINCPDLAIFVEDKPKAAKPE